MDQRLVRIINDFGGIAERVKAMSGEVSSAEGKAVRAGQLQVLASITATPKTREVTAAPTADEFNSLLKDVQELYAKISKAAQSISNGG